MSKVYIVELYIDYEGSTLLGVYSSEAFATAALVLHAKADSYRTYEIKKLDGDFMEANYSDHHLSIQEVELDVFPG